MKIKITLLWKWGEKLRATKEETTKFKSVRGHEWNVERVSMEKEKEKKNERIINLKLTTANKQFWSD